MDIAERDPRRVAAPARAVTPRLEPRSADVPVVSPATSLDVAAAMDLGSRERFALGVQRTAGNAALQRQPKSSDLDLGPNPYPTETKGGGAVTELGANPYSGEREPITLTNPRFKGQPRLERIAAGKAVLSAADNGAPMKAIQQAFVDLGFELVRHERDGQFGDETKTAIRLFRQRRSIPGHELTARALFELDRTAPRAGTAEEHFFDYERLFADGYLDVTLAVGYDENQHHVRMIKEARDWLAARGFRGMPQDKGKPEEFRLRRTVNYPTKMGNRITREVIIRVSLITPGEGAAGQFGKALKDSEIAIYNGHARRGIGPDFDDAKSAKENFIIGVASALHAAGRAIEPKKVEQDHYVIKRQNDLERMSKEGAFDKDKYRIWLFEACTTIAYFDEIRNGLLPEKVDRRNLDLLGTRQAAPLITEMAASLAMLDGIVAAKTIEQITAAMDKAGEDIAMAIPDSEISAADRKTLLGMTRNLNVHEGAGDNPIAPRAP